MIIGNPMYPLPASYSGISKLSSQMDTLESQLASGQKAQTLADMGNVRYTDLTVRARLSRLTSYDFNIDTVNLRLGMINQVLDSVSSVNTDARTGVTAGGYGTNNINLATAPSLAGQQLDQVLSAFNTDLNGHYLFGGSAVDKAPVATTDAIMNGTNGKSGFITVAAQRLEADQGGPTGLGRLQPPTVAGNDVTLAEDGNGNFGFKLATVTSSNPQVVASGPSGVPNTLDVQFNAQPSAGDTVSIGLKLPDGTTDTVTLTATAGPDAGPGQFLIGVDADATAANFQGALTGSLQTETQTTLAAASNNQAANDFFFSAGGSVERPAVGTDGTYATATGFDPNAASDTVQWYTGANADETGARASVTTKVDDTANVSYGVQANEAGFADLVRGLAVQSIQTYPTTDDATLAQSKAKFDAVAERQTTNLSALNDSKPGSITSIGVDLGLTQTTLKDLSDRHTSYTAQLQDVVGNAENADPNEVVSALLALQTRLSASFQAVSMISQLQLSNYLR